MSLINYGNDLAVAVDIALRLRDMSDRSLKHSDKENSMKALVARFVREESGQDLIEYGLLIGIITVACITAISLIVPKVAGYFTTLEAALP